MNRLPKRMLLLILLLVVIPAAGNAAQERTAAGGGAPTGLSAVNTIPPAPVIPVFVWTTSGAVAHNRLYVRTVGATSPVIDQMYAEPTTWCGPVGDGTNYQCGATSLAMLPAWGLVDGNYEWWVGADFSGVWAWSDKATFTVDVPAAALPTNINVEPWARPRILFDNDPNTFWVQVWVGPHPDGDHNQWYERDGANPFTCTNTTCIISGIAWDRISKDASGTPYNLTLWMRAWGPGGFSSGGAVVDQWNQLSMVNASPGTTFQLPVNPPANPTNLLSYISGQLTWQGTDTSASWQNVMAYDNATGTGIGGNSWYLGSTIGCLEQPDFLCEINVYDWAAQNLTGTAPSYDLYIRSWGPGGMSGWTQAPVGLAN